MTAKQDQLFKKALSETYKYAALMHVKDYTKLSFNDVARAIKESNEFRGIRTTDVQALAESVTKHLKESVMSEIDLAISDAKADGLDNAAIARDLASKYRIGLADAEHLVAQWTADNLDENSSGAIAEVGYADALGNLNMPHSEIIAAAQSDGTVSQRPVMKFEKDGSTVYFFESNNDIDALVLLSGNNLKAIKNFTGKKGLVFALLNYIVSMKGVEVRIDANEPLTPEGFKWVAALIKNKAGLRVRDQAGQEVDVDALKAEWNRSRAGRGEESGSTGLVITESSKAWSSKLLENEKRVMPFAYFNVSARRQINEATSALAQWKQKVKAAHPTATFEVRKKTDRYGSDRVEANVGDRMVGYFEKKSGRSNVLEAAEKSLKVYHVDRNGKKGYTVVDSAAALQDHIKGLKRIGAKITHTASIVNGQEGPAVYPKAAQVDETFPYDVDHMPGQVIRNADMTTDNVYTRDYAQWERAVNSINRRVFDDNSSLISDSNRKIALDDDGDILWAQWDKKKNSGWFNSKGRQVRPYPVKENVSGAIAEASESAIKLGDKIRTIKMGQIPGVVEKIDGDWVIFRHESGKLYRAPMSNVRLDESLSGRSSFDRAHQRFKHDELAQELKGEDQYYQKMQAQQTSKWYIRIDGRLWRKNGQPVEFNGRNHATAAAATIQKRSPGKIVTLTTIPTDVEKHRLFKEDVGDAAAAYINKIAYSKVHPNNIGRFRREATDFIENNRGASASILKAGLMALAYVFAKANLTETDDETGRRINEARSQPFNQFGPQPKRRQSAQQKAIAQRNRAYWEAQPVIEPKDQYVGNARIIRNDPEVAEEMTPTQTRERERIVKGMKKNKADFKDRYGKRGEEVMYATATKRAMGEDSDDQYQQGLRSAIEILRRANQEFQRTGDRSVLDRAHREYSKVYDQLVAANPEAHSRHAATRQVWGPAGTNESAGSIIDSRAYNQLVDMVPDSVKRKYGIDAVARAVERAVDGREGNATVRDVIQWLKHDEESRSEAEDWHELQRLPRNRW